MAARTQPAFTRGSSVAVATSWLNSLTPLSQFSMRNGLFSTVMADSERWVGLPFRTVCTLLPRFFREVMEESFAGCEQPLTAEGLSGAGERHTWIRPEIVHFVILRMEQDKGCVLRRSP